MQSDTFKENSMPAPVLLRAIKENDERALQLFYQKNFAAVKRYVLENNGDEDEAKDIYQESFITVWRNIQSGKLDESSSSNIDGYLYQVAKFKWIDHLRSQKRKPVFALKDDDASFNIAEEDKADEEKITLIRKHFAKLGEGCRDLLSRFYYLRQSMKVIATDNGWTEPTAKNNKYRCLQKLRELFKNN